MLIFGWKTEEAQVTEVVSGINMQEDGPPGPMLYVMPTRRTADIQILHDLM